MNWSILRSSALLVLLALCGCQSPPPPEAPPAPAPSKSSGKKSFDPTIRHNALALLSDLLNDEKHLSKILLIKLESRELDQVVKAISATAGDGAKWLDTLAKNEPGLQLQNLGLPPGEEATRKAIAKTKQRLLLHSRGAEFEFQILLTQMQALNYGAHLASVIAEHEPDPAQARKFSDLSVRLNELQNQVLAMLRKAH